MIEDRSIRFEGVFRNKIFRIGASAGALAIFCLSMVTYVSIAPAGFPDGATISIEEGTTLDQTSNLLASRGLVRSSTAFKLYAALLGGTAGVKQGEYAFASPQSALWIAYRLDHGIEGFPLAKVTLPEGVNTTQIAAIISRFIPGFDKAGFLALAKPYEGYLFPDTYFWPSNLTPQKAVSDMRDDFDARTASTTRELSAFGKSESDVIKMASIVEKESASSTERKVIAGILWKRLSLGMPLQADPTLEYALGKSSSQLTLADLATSSPYNTYNRAGLPPTPIDSPGLDAIEDTVMPTQTPYLYYLSGGDGVTHYATTLEGQIANKAKYLN